MADQGLWFKLWCAADDDPDLDNLDLADFGRFCKLGIRVKSQGNAGTLTIRPPARTLCAKFQVADFDALVMAFQRLPHVTVRRAEGDVSTETGLVVSFHNWLRYQGDFSTPRVRQFRVRETAKRRGEEIRGDETRRDVSPVVPHGGPESSVLEFLNQKTGKNFRPKAINLGLIKARLADGITETQLRAIVSRKVHEWRNTEQEKYLRPATLFNKTKCEQYLGELPKPAVEESHA